METDSIPTAASCCDVDFVKRLIGAGENMNAIDPDGATALHLAISSGKSSDIVSQIVGLLMKAGASLNVRNNEGYFPLHVAAANGQVESVDMLIRAGADVNAEINPGGVTSLFLAIKHDQPDNNCSKVIRLLIEAGVSLVLQDANRFSPLRKAVVLGKVNAVRQLILSGAKVNEFNNAGKSILHHASISLKNDECMCRIIQMLLEAGAFPNIPDSQGFTPLHAAATLGKARRVDQLIQAGADVDAIDQSRFVTILHSVISSVESDGDRFEVVQLLLQAGASLNLCDRYSYDALLRAAASRRVKTVEQLILAGANVNSLHPKSGESCLHLVAKWQKKNDYCLAITRLLLETGANINARDYNQRTPLHNVAGSGNIQLFKQFIEVGADVHVQDSADRTILYVAISRRLSCNVLLEMIRTLLGAGVSVENSSNLSKPLVHHAIARGSIEIVEELISAGIDVQAVDQDGSTCFHAAVLASEKYASNCSQIVRILSNAGVSINSCDDRQRTPLHIAVSKGYAYWVESLIEAGANVNAKDQIRQTSLTLAMELENPNERLSIIRLLTQAGASVVEHAIWYRSPLEIAVVKGNLLAVELKQLVQAYVNEHPNPEISRRLELIAADEDSVNYRLEVIRLLLMAEVLLELRYTPLHYAVKTGNVALVEVIIKEGDDVNATTSSQETSLHLALCSHLEITIRHQIVELLLRANAPVNVSDRHGTRPLTHALTLNDEKMVQHLITAGADPRIIDDLGRSCLHDSVLNKGHRDPSKVISILIDAGAPVNVIDNCQHRTPLHYAVLWGHVEAVEKLIRAGVDVDVADRRGLTCLHYAPPSTDYSDHLRHGSFEIDHSTYKIIRLLLEAGANPDARDCDGVTPLMNAAHHGDLVFVEKLIKAGADVNLANTRDTCTALDWVCNDVYPSVLKGSTCRIVSLLVAAGAEITRPVEYPPPFDPTLRGRRKNAHDHYLDCRRDLQLMRESIFDGSITYYEIYKTSRVSDYVRNKSVIGKFESGEFTALFPIYGKDLEESFRAAKAKRDLMDQANNGLQCVLGFCNDLIHNRILECLHDEDLLNLCST